MSTIYLIFKLLMCGVAINFLLLIFSINKKTDRSEVAHYEKPKI